MSVSTFSKPPKPRPDLRARLRAARERIIRDGVHCYAVSSRFGNEFASSWETACKTAFARSWGNIGEEYLAEEFAVDPVNGHRVNVRYQRFQVVVMA